MPTHLRWATRFYPFEQAATDEETYLGARANFAAMLLTGTTCFNDPGGYHVDATAQAAVDSGIRGIVTRSGQDISSKSVPVPPSALEITDAVMDNAARLYERWNGQGAGRISVWYSLRSVYNSSDELCRRIKEAADERSTGIHCHLAVTERENELCLQQWGVRPLERFRRLGLLGPNLYLVHMGAVTSEEIGLLKEFDVKVCHCPSASMLGGFGCIAHGRFPEMLKRGVTVSIGTDAAAVSRFLDMIRVMYLAATAHKDAETDPLAVGCYKALEMATVDGARALGKQAEIGSLEPGKKADLAILAVDGPDWHPNPLANPVANLVYAASGASVRTVVVDGRVLVEESRLTNADADDLWARCDRASADVLARAGIDLRPAWPVT
jgi:5-methylthioadenosine/S-adenosylhomocysteine deaminase